MAQDYEIYTFQEDKLKEDYIAKILSLLRKCNDIDFLDFIYKLLYKGI